jgi:hypothetical protein
MALLTFRDFDRMDWMSFAGAQKFDDGSEPRIVVEDLSEGNKTWSISFDNNGIEVDCFIDAEEFEMQSYALERGSLSKLSMERLAANINPLVDDLYELGFERIV